MKHKFYKCPPNCEDPYCNYCEGGLCYCTTCKAAEGQLSTHCIGRELTEDEKESIYTGGKDIINGQWINKKPKNHQSWRSR